MSSTAPRDDLSTLQHHHEQQGVGCHLSPYQSRGAVDAEEKILSYLWYRRGLPQVDYGNDLCASVCPVEPQLELPRALAALKHKTSNTNHSVPPPPKNNASVAQAPRSSTSTLVFRHLLARAATSSISLGRKVDGSELGRRLSTARRCSLCSRSQLRTSGYAAALELASDEQSPRSSPCWSATNASYGGGSRTTRRSIEGT